MNDKEYERQKTRIQKYIDKWIPMLGLKWWTLKIVYDRENPPYDDCNNQDFRYSTGVVTSVNYPYRNACIKFFLTELKTWDSIELEKAVIHKCVHVLTNEIRDVDKDINHEERAVTDLTNAFYWTYKRCK